MSLTMMLKIVSASGKAIGPKVKVIKFGLEAPRGQGLALRSGLHHCYRWLVQSLAILLVPL